jgi:2-phosphosulfolactate phosphatase
MSSSDNPFSQSSYRCKLYRGRHGAREAAAQKDILVIVDTISFSTAAVTAVHHGGLIFPCTWGEDRFVYARSVQAEAAVGRQEVPEKGRFSLSPLTYLHLEPDTRIAVASANGATCSQYAQNVPYLLVGALINARAVANVLTHLLDTTDHDLTLIACGERWDPPTEDGELRVAIEDDLGAGAILSYLNYGKSPEARVCEGAFQQVQSILSDVLEDCGSGRELAQKGFEGDVKHAAQLDLYDTVPILKNGRLEPFLSRKA